MKTKPFFGTAPARKRPDFRVKRHVFIMVWGIVAVILTVAILLVVWSLLALGVLPSGGWYLTLLVPIILFATIWNRRIKVPPRWEYVWEWGGAIGEPLISGWYFVPRIFGLFRLVGKVPMYDQFINIISGDREDIGKDLVESHPYGTKSDIEPKSGAVVKMIYSLRVKCEDSAAAIYKMDDPFSYIALSVEKKVVEFAKTIDSESLGDRFNSHDWQAKIDSLASDIKESTGFMVLELIPQDIINTPEVQSLRNQVGEQQLRGELLEAELLNKEKEVKIASKDNTIKASRLKVLSETLGDSELAADVWKAEVRADSIKEAAKNKNLILMDADVNESLTRSAARASLRKRSIEEDE